MAQKPRRREGVGSCGAGQIDGAGTFLAKAAPVANSISGTSANMVIAPGKGRGVIRGGLLSSR